MNEIYFDFPLKDGSRICVLRYERMDQIDHIQPDDTIPNHLHEFYEMVLILKGTCEHVYQDRMTTLLPGDLFLIPPHCAHAYRFYEDVDHINCQFYPDALPSEWLEGIQALRYDRLQRRRTLSFQGKADLNRQGILHLEAQEAAELQRLLMEIRAEQCEHRLDAERMKRSLLQIVLIRLDRVQDRQFMHSEDIESWKLEMVEKTLSDFEADLSETLDNTTLARRYHVSVSYFRNIFKEITGLPPHQYLNRVRIVRAVEYINHYGMDISRAAEQVGIHDPNYFARLCRKITGFPPSHFQKQSG